MSFPAKGGHLAGSIGWAQRR